ncbi:hypothetical protein SK128_023048 [Halocaridina rubra]|uniref:Uncharacterized protein n=1 Tax=Halocaridina rubra TaxID=373956 RepID=A0AAN8X4B4_HALRR
MVDTDKSSTSTMHWFSRAILVFWAALPVIAGTAAEEGNVAIAEDEEPSTELSHNYPPLAPKGSPPMIDVFDFYDEDDDPILLRRLKRDMYDRDPWGRIPPRQSPYYRRGRYNNRRSRYNTRKFSRGRRREHHNYRGPGYGDDFEDTKHRLTNAGYVDLSVFNGPPKPNNNFVSARASGIARTETTGGSK